MASVGASAQHEVGSVSLMPKGGLNISTLTNGDDTEMRYGIVAGAEVEYMLDKQFGISAGLLYSQQGVRVKYKELPKSAATFSLNYINIPILANIYVAKGLALKVGVQPGFNVASSARASLFSLDKGDDVQGTKSLDLSVPVGISYVSEYDILLDVRYNWGLTKVNSFLDNSMNSVFQFTVGYKLKL